MTSPAQTAWIHWLAPPALLMEAAPVIQQAVLKVLGVSDRSRHVVTVSESSGYLYYEDRQEMTRSRPPSALPRTAEQARACAEKFLGDLGRELMVLRPKFPASLQKVVMVPALRPVEVLAVARPGAQGWDHWLYRAQPRLPLLGGRSIDVDGALFEVRIGEGAKIISFTARWQPLTGGRFEEALLPPPHDEHDHDHEDGHSRGFGDQNDATPLAYVLDGETMPQYYLAPYYVIVDGHHSRLASAGRFSLTIDVEWRQPEGDWVEARAIVSGGSGRYDYGFASYRLDAFWDGEPGVVVRPATVRSFRDESGTNFTAGVTLLAPALQVLLVNVRDRRTGAFRHAQRQVIAGPVTDQRSRAVA